MKCGCKSIFVSRVVGKQHEMDFTFSKQFFYALTKTAYRKVVLPARNNYVSITN